MGYEAIVLSYARLGTMQFATSVAFLHGGVLLQKRLRLPGNEPMRFPDVRMSPMRMEVDWTPGRWVHFERGGSVEDERRRPTHPDDFPVTPTSLVITERVCGWRDFLATAKQFEHGRLLGAHGAFPGASVTGKTVFVPGDASCAISAAYARCHVRILSRDAVLVLVDGRKLRFRIHDELLRLRIGDDDVPVRSVHRNVLARFELADPERIPKQRGSRCRIVLSHLLV